MVRLRAKEEEAVVSRVRYLVAGGLIAGLIAITGCSNLGQPLNTPNSQPLCIALGGLNARVQDFKNLPPTATVDDYKTAAIGVSAAYQTVNAQIQTLANAQASQLASAFDQLQRAAQALPAGTTPEQAKSELADEVAAVDSAMESARAALACPPFPTPVPS
jgi:hypothetical protein